MNNKRKDIFFQLEDSFNLLEDENISLFKIHQIILKTVSPLLEISRYQKVFYTVSRYREMEEDNEAVRGIYLNPDVEHVEAFLIYGKKRDNDPAYIIRVDVDGVSLVNVNGVEKDIRIRDCRIPFCNVDLTSCNLGLDRNGLLDLNTIITNFDNPNLSNEEALRLIAETTEYTGWIDLVYIPFFANAFECLCRSVLCGEYAMDDNFSHRVRELAKKLRDATLKKDLENQTLWSWFNYLSKCIVTLTQILDEYNLFCIQIDAQVDKEPSSVLRKAEEYYDRHDYVKYLHNFMANDDGGFSDNANPLLLHFFQSFLEMARIDQNFYFSTGNFASLMYLRELLQDDNKGADNVTGEQRGKGLVQIWKKCKNDSLQYDFKGVQEVLELARLKNGILLRKMWEGCYKELKDLTYVGQDKVLIFDPRKCREKEVGEEYHTELLLSDKLFDDSKKDRVKDLLNKTKALVTDTCLEETNDKTFEGYEKEYIKAKWGDEDKAIKATGDYYRSIMMSQTSHTSLDIRHYNSKVIEMSRDAVFYTADYRIWIKHHKYDYEEAVAFPQIHKVLLFLQNRYSEGDVCYDSEMLEGYARWCIEFLNTISKKTPEPDSSRPSQLEETLLLLETINSLLDRLVVSIEKGNYCLPFASKFRGCFFKYNEQDNNKPVLERVFVEGVGDNGYKKEDFELFLSAGTSEEKWNGWSDDEQIEIRKDILFIASSFVPPFNLERLKALKTKFKRGTHKLRNEIHAEYFNRLREYVKEDSLKQLEENRRSVVQILGIFAAFLALTTVALGASTANQSDFISIMIGFTICITVFVGLLYFITRRNIRKSVEKQNEIDNSSLGWIYEEVNKLIRAHVVSALYESQSQDLSNTKFVNENNSEKPSKKVKTNDVEFQKINEKITNRYREEQTLQGRLKKTFWDCLNNWDEFVLLLLLLALAILIGIMIGHFINP